jgi:protein-export membrane protein SecD
LQFDQVSGQPIVALQFNSEGEELFAQITRENVGEVLGIFLDGAPISLPVINEEIRGGEAVISGGFSVEEARNLVRDLRFGALPVPIELVGTQTIGPTLGARALEAGVQAGLVGFSLVVIFLIIWYRLPGLLASIALVIYIIINLAIFKLVPVTLSAAGLAGFILSIGMAVDANILIFERLKEELLSGRGLLDSIEEGFKRAWLSIRDGNISTILTAVILFYTTTSLVRGFALTLGIGVLVSIFTAITITRTFLLAVVPKEGGSEKLKTLFGSGLLK